MASKSSFYQRNEQKKLLDAIAKKYGISRSTVLNTLLETRAKEILAGDGDISEEFKEIAKKALAGEELRELRIAGKVFARDIIYESVNLDRMMKAIDKSRMSEEEKEYCRIYVEELAKKKKTLAGKIVDNPKNRWYIPPQKHVDKHLSIDAKLNRSARARLIDRGLEKQQIEYVEEFAKKRGIEFYQAMTILGIGKKE